jgi:CTP:molybdopterin cytidylyltransferase MocA
MKIPAIVTAGDRRAARAVYGESKVYLEVDGLPLVARVVAVLQRVPEISEVWVVGDAERLADVFGRSEVSEQLEKPLHILGQFRNLFENCWESYRRALPDAGPDGRDPQADDVDFQVLYLSADLPFATAEEISDFIRRGQATGCDYALGLVPEESLRAFLPTANDGVGIQFAYFNMCEGRLRQSNLHLAKPGNMGARELIEEMYEHRHQRNPWNMVAIGLKLLANRSGGARVFFFYLLIHLGGLADRWGFRRLADWFRRVNTLARTEEALGRLLRTRFRFVITSGGGCAVDVDTEREYDVVKARFHEWTQAQQARVRALSAGTDRESVAADADTDTAEKAK